MTKPHWAEGTPSLSSLTKDIPPDLQSACELANRVAYSILGYRNSCVLTSHALAAFLKLRRYEPCLVRPEWHVFPECRCDFGDCHGRAYRGGALSWDGDGSRRPASRPGYWNGHLAVTCDGYLLDPTIDQLNNESVHLPCLVISLAGWWDKGTDIRFVNSEGTFVRGNKYHRQAGWKSRPDARPSHWHNVLHQMVSVWLHDQARLSP